MTAFYIWMCTVMELQICVPLVCVVDHYLGLAWRDVACGSQRVCEPEWNWCYWCYFAVSFCWRSVYLSSSCSDTEGWTWHRACWKSSAESNSSSSSASRPWGIRERGTDTEGGGWDGMMRKEQEEKETRSEKTVFHPPLHSLLFSRTWTTCCAFACRKWRLLRGGSKTEDCCGQNCSLVLRVLGSFSSARVETEI